MGTFKDTKGQSWTIESLTIGAVLRVKRDSGGRIDLLEPGAKVRNRMASECDPGVPLFELLQFDLIEFWEMLAYLLGPDISGRGMTSEQFGEVMSGDGLMDAKDLFFAEWAGFFRRLRRPDHAAALEKTIAYTAKAVKALEARTKSQDLERVDKLVDQKIEDALNESFGSLLASLESTPDPTP